MTFLPEGDVYRLIVHSRLPGAERFEKWVFDEVLPTIRRTGGYMTPSLLEEAARHPEILLSFADQLLAEHEKNRRLTGEVERLRPKADFYDAFVRPGNCTNIRATAKELGVGERDFCRFLMEEGFLYRCPAGYLLPYAKPSNKGLFQVKDFWKYGHFRQLASSNPISRLWQKKRLQKQYAAAHRAGTGAAQAAGKASQTAASAAKKGGGTIAQKLGGFVTKNKHTLVFFVGTYDTSGISHVGIYVGDNMMLHCGDPISYTNLNTSYWQSHFYAYGRPPYN